jgi:DNA-binding SARP family transcriptional activator
MLQVSTLQAGDSAGRPRNEGAPPLEQTACAPIRPAEPFLRISVLDGLAVSLGNQEVPVGNRKARALLAYLALAPGMRETRERLVGLLWSETEEAKARGSLRQLLHILRETFHREGIPGLSADKDHIRLDQSVIATDLECAIASVDRGDPADALLGEPRVTELLLRGYEDVDPSFGSWLTTKRESVRRQFIRRLEAQLTNHAHRPEVAGRIARALFQMDPTHEIACQHLMRACVAAGNVGGALAAYKQLWQCLEEDYDIEPSAVTQQLVVAIKCGGSDLRGTDAGSGATVAAGDAEIDPVVLVALKLAMAWMAALGAGGSVRKVGAP